MNYRENLVQLALILFILFFVNIEAFAIPARIVGKNAVTHSSNTGMIVNASPDTGMVAHVAPSPYMVIPFILLLVMIAVLPLLYKRLWHNHYAKISIGLGLLVAGYYVLVLGNSEIVLHTLAEYISFIALISSLFVASSGILIKVDKKATPVLNVLFLFIGAVAANIIGTTGASMLLIRPFIRMNKGRIKPYHIIFFIFLVSNIGGALTPIGTPMFLGFLSGVPFFWVISNVWYIWFPVVLIVLFIFYFYDVKNKKPNQEDVLKVYSGKILIRGHKNFIYLAVIVAAIFIDPAVFSWIPDLSPLPFGIRELVMFAVVYLSYKYADKKVLQDNEFDFEPVKEVGYLFLGIFLTMIPAIQLIASAARTYSDKLNAGVFYWASGTLSAALDNMPTYMNFFSAAMGKYGLDATNKAHVLQFIKIDEIYLKAISVASVFFGAATYIGNGPNFMVKSISERAGIEMPGFFTYIIKYSLISLFIVFLWERLNEWRLILL
jgi:Na+/H+ antiporter NhaD/arsenite permease-like protein